MTTINTTCRNMVKDRNILSEDGDRIWTYRECSAPAVTTDPPPRSA